MSSLMTRSANTVSQLNENDISSLIILILNMIYKNATGSRETFNFNGKTDIILKIDEFVQFIGEAKIWKGWKYIKNGVDTLIGKYRTQFDTKLVVPIYIMDGTKFDTVLDAIKNGIQDYASCQLVPFNRKLLEEADFAHQYEFEVDDSSRKIRISFIVFDFSIR